MKRIITLICAVLMLTVSGITSTLAHAETPSTDEHPSVIYEAFFLNNDEIRDLFVKVRGPEAPYAIMTQDFHVTTAFMPEKDMHEFYGTEVTVRVNAYQTGEVRADDGSMTANEGFFCSVEVDNPEFQDYLDSLGKNWHITGSYKDQGGAKYTGMLDLTDAQAVEFTVTGRFGGYLSNNSIVFSMEDAIQLEEASYDTVTKRSPDTHSLAQLYGQTDMAHVYSLERIALDGCSVQNADMKGGYIMLTMNNSAPDLPDSGELVLFPVGDPDASVSMGASPDCFYYLLDGGIVAGVSDDSHYTLYNDCLQEICHGQGEGQFIGVSNDGSLWFFSAGEQLLLHQAGEQVLTLDAGDLLYCNYVGQSNGKAYFDAISDTRGQIYLCIDLQTLLCTEQEMLHDTFDVSNGMVCYSSDDYWYTACLDDPLTVLAFTKPYSDATMWQMDDHYLISQQLVFDDSTSSRSYRYCVYDMRNGGLYGQYTEGELAEHKASMRAYDQGLILYSDTDDKQSTTKLYLWDLREQSSPQPARYYKKLDFHVDQARVDDLIGILHNIYDINIYYDEQSLAATSISYQLVPCTDMKQIGYALVMLRECMAEYPRDFFDEIRTSDFHQVQYILCYGHIPKGSNIYKDAAATASWKNDTLTMTFDIQNWWNMRIHFLHENTHLMEKRLEAEAWKINQTDYNQYWYEQLNSPECPSMQSYMWAQEGDNLKGVYGFNRENAWYIDAYSKSTMLEDRARTMDRGIHSQYAACYQSPHIERKLRFLNALIREVFPCVHNSETEMFWEARTGIVDLHEEFPDFAGIHY